MKTAFFVWTIGVQVPSEELTPEQFAKARHEAYMQVQENNCEVEAIVDEAEEVEELHS